MGNISKRLHRKLARQSGNLPTKAPTRRPGEPLPGNVKDVQTLINEGLDPIHAVYAYIQQLTSHFAERVSLFPEMKSYAKAIARAEEEYLPSGPPMSPLTRSFFTTWAFYDFRIGGTGNAVAECQTDANDVLLMNSDQLEALKNLQSSRMGIYEHGGVENDKIRLRELITDQEFSCHCGSGYTGQPGELWYARLLSPLLPEHADYHIVFTTPYILIHSTRGDWGDFLSRSILPYKSNTRQALYRLLKYGPEPQYWNEFVLKAYHHHQSDAIFLAGVPDLQDSLPHA